MAYRRKQKSDCLTLRCHKMRCDMNRQSGYGLVGLLVLILIFHTLLFLQVIPFEMVRDSANIPTNPRMYFLEMVSFMTNCFFLFVVLVRTRLVSSTLSYDFCTKVLWFMVFIFVVNTVANALTQNHIQRLISVPVTFIMAYFSLLLAITKNDEIEESETTQIPIDEVSQETTQLSQEESK